MPIEIVPGVTAASAAAAALGAPLMLDFAVISLSDLLVSWEVIRRRLEAVAAADLVVALYNPRSKKRVRQLQEAVADLSGRPSGPYARRHRYGGRPGRPVAGRDRSGPSAQEDVNMRTVVIIGNSSTRRIDHWMVTARGYLERTRRGVSPMILLLGGTSDAWPIAWQLAEAGHVCWLPRRATCRWISAHPNIESRAGRLDQQRLAALIDARGIRAIVDATHPYATAIHAAARRVAAEKGIRCFCFVRPAVVEADTPGVEFAADHATAAVAAFRRGRPVLLTTGTKHLTPYVAESRRTGLPLVVRALDAPASLEACRRAAVALEQIIAGRGPFSVEANRQQLRAFKIGVLVMKDSGAAGGAAKSCKRPRPKAAR